jgi:cytochrome P450
VEGYIKEMNLQQQNNVTTEELYGFINQVAQESATTEDLRDQLLNVLLAGRDTTACCLSWTLYVFLLLVFCHSALTDALLTVPAAFLSATLR